MPSPYRRDARRLKAEILARVLAGESLRAICGSAGMPHKDTVRTWAKADPLFAADLLAARRRGAWTKLYAYDEGRAEAFMARARAGETIRALLREPGGLSEVTYRYWKATQPSFQAALFALRRRRDAAFQARGRAAAAARRRDFDQALADRLIVALHKAAPMGLPGARLEAVLAADPALPCRPTLARWRREEPVLGAAVTRILAMRRATGLRAPELLARDIVGHIAEGGSFASYARWPGAPSRGTLRRWYRADTGFARAVDAACERREEMLDFELWVAAEQVPPGPVREMNRAVAPITRAIARLRHRPGAAHRRRGGKARSEREG